MVETQLIASLRRNTKKGEHDFIKGTNPIIIRANTWGKPLRIRVLNDVAQTICSALLVVNFLYGGRRSVCAKHK